MKQVDLAVIGGGAAGIAAALEARAAGLQRVLLFDREEDLGGILNELIEAGHGLMAEGVTGVEVSEDLKERVRLSGVEVKLSTLVLEVSGDKVIRYVSGKEGVREVAAQTVVFATGARERPRGELNISYNRSAGIMSVGSARKLIVRDGYLPGKEVVIYGHDINGLYLSKMLIIEGARKVTIVEPSRSVKLEEAYLKDILDMGPIEFLVSTKIVNILENGRITGVRVRSAEGVEHTIPCDSLLLSVGLDPSKRLFKKFRRKMPERGMFVAGNAEEVSFDLQHVMARGRLAGQQAVRHIQEGPR